MRLRYHYLISRELVCFQAENDSEYKLMIIVVIYESAYHKAEYSRVNTDEAPSGRSLGRSSNERVMRH